MREIEVVLKPRPQFREFLTRQQRFACVVAHRRAGKTFACAQDLMRAALGYVREGPPCRYAYVAPTRDQAKDIVWPYLTDFSSQLPGTQVNKAELTITYANKATVRLYSGESYDRMRGLYFDGVVIDEPADIDPNAWPYVILPCLSDYGGWATFIGTCKGKNAFYRIYRTSLTDPGWFTMMLKASDSGIIKPEELKSLRSNMTGDAYAQEYECDWTVGRPGAIYARFVEQARQENRIATMPVDGTAPVHTAWDLGSPRNTVVWYFQTVGRMIRLLACDRDHDETIVNRVARMKAKGWPYGYHFLPHDAEQTERSGRTLAQELASAGLTNLRIVPRCVSVWPGINHAQELFPAFEFRSPECDGGLEALEAYHTKEVNEKDRIIEDPIHDWSSHTADAFRTLAEAHAAGMFKFSWKDPEPMRDFIEGTWNRPKRGVKPIRVGG